MNILSEKKNSDIKIIGGGALRSYVNELNPTKFDSLKGEMGINARKLNDMESRSDKRIQLITLKDITFKLQSIANQFFATVFNFVSLFDSIFISFIFSFIFKYKVLKRWLMKRATQNILNKQRYVIVSGLKTLTGNDYQCQNVGGRGRGTQLTLNFSHSICAAHRVTDD